MALIDIKAHFACDGCNKPISVELDAGYKPPAGWSVYDVAVDEVRGGGHAGKGVDAILDDAPTSVQCDMILCPVCTSRADAIGDDDYSPTADEIRAAINA